MQVQGFYSLSNVSFIFLVQERATQITEDEIPFFLFLVLNTIA